MKTLICLVAALSVAGLLHGCSSGSTAAAPPAATAPPPAATVSGIDTPKSVAVVTAN